MMSVTDSLEMAKTKLAKATRKRPPVRCAHAPSAVLAGPAKRILYLQFKGFLGGVPPNTEKTAVNPRVGIDRCQEVFVLLTKN
jgi:hypothetical protein